MDALPAKQERSYNPSITAHTFLQSFPIVSLENSLADQSDQKVYLKKLKNTPPAGVGT